ncbi:MAG: choice-of-anchor tandem repeat GloVer-containing protein [Rhodospirillales bacterium]
MYGTTDGGGAAGAGTVFKLTPPAAGQTAWTESVLYSFFGGADGGGSFASLMMDKTGALYGTTITGGDTGAGVVFKLTPPGAGQTAWTESVVYSFAGGSDGYDPWGAVIEDSSGALYGTTTLGGDFAVGNVFKLTPPVDGQGVWAETTLYSFTGGDDGGVPFAGLIQDQNGALYGTTAGRGKGSDGVVFRLTPPAGGKGKWKETVLHAFRGGADGSSPAAALIADSAGVLYGTTDGGATSHGTVFKLTPPTDGSNHWAETVLTRFQGGGFNGNGPWASVSQDAAGALYGTLLAAGSSTFGSVFKLTPPAAGATKWTRSVLSTFKAGQGGQFPYSNLVVGTNGTLYGTTFGSVNQKTGRADPGTVFQITQ